MAESTKHSTGAGGVKRQRSRVIQLGASIDVTLLETLHAQWLKALHSGRPIAIDGGRVEHIDCAALQLLCALWRDAANHDIQARWRNVSPAICDAAGIAGLSCQLGLSADPGD